MRAVPRDSFTIAVPVAFAVAVFSFALGSSAVAPLAEAGRTLRWAALVVLVGLAALWVAREGSGRALPLATLAAGGLLVALAALSTLWSVDPALTFARAGSLGLLFAAAALVALASARSDAAVERVLWGVLAGATAVAIAGLVLLAVAPRTAVASATELVPARYRGLGENPNTAALLLAVASPVAVWLAFARSRLLGIALALLFAGSIAAAGSRGAVAAALVGALVVVGLQARSTRAGAVLAVVAVLVAAAAVAAGRVPQPAQSQPPPAPATETAATPYDDVERTFPLEDDIGRSLPGGGQVEQPRELLGTSGRWAAWKAAARQAAERPVVGYGFGTEDRVFVDRYANFAGGVPENSYLGLFLQLGVGGLVAFAFVLAAVVAAGRQALRSSSAAAAAAGIVAAGLVAALAQSYFTSVGNIATATFWTGAFLLAALGAARRPQRA